MALTPIGLGQFSGRVGGVVYAVQAGRQVVRAYQPVVSNPKSASQCIQRAKGNLAGRISKIVPWQILEGLGDNKFNRRSRLLRLLLRNISAGQAAGDPSQFNAKLMDEDFIFSEGALPSAYYLSSLSAGFNSFSVSVNRFATYSADDALRYGILLVGVVKQSSGVWEEVVYRFVAPSELSSGSTAFTFPLRSEGAYTVAMYYAPFGSVDGSKLPTVSGELTSTATSLNALLEVGASASSIEWGASLFYQAASYTPA